MEGKLVRRVPRGVVMQSWAGNTKQNDWSKLISTKTEARATNEKRDEKPPLLMLQDRVNQSQLFLNQVRSITNA